ncbi:MAG: hypothetical protein LBV28_04740, partial [Puniceicoccales bacterium]|nr:hypothetical protein [Puniceicoccales bacterium]
MKTHPRLCAVALFNCFAVALLFFATAGLRAEETTAPIATTGDVTGLVVDADGEPVASISMEDFVNYRTYQGSPLLAARLGASKRSVGTKTGAVSGLVVNAQGEPVAGAKVEIFVNCPMYQGSIREGTDEIHVVTGKDGVWHYAKMLRDIRAMEMSVSHNDYAMEREPWGLLTDCEQLQKMVFAGELKTVLKER